MDDRKMYMPSQSNDTRTNGSGASARRTFEDCMWLMKLLGPKVLAEMTRPLTSDECAEVEKILAWYEREFPVHSAIMAASDAELPGVVERILSGQDSELDLQNAPR